VKRWPECTGKQAVPTALVGSVDNVAAQAGPASPLPSPAKAWARPSQILANGQTGLQTLRQG